MSVINSINGWMKLYDIKMVLSLRIYGRALFLLLFVLVLFYSNPHVEKILKV